MTRPSPAWMGRGKSASLSYVAAAGQPHANQDQIFYAHSLTDSLSSSIDFYQCKLRVWLAYCGDISSENAHFCCCSFVVVICVCWEHSQFSNPFVQFGWGGSLAWHRITLNRGGWWCCYYLLPTTKNRRSSTTTATATNCCGEEWYSFRFDFRGRNYGPCLVYNFVFD